MKRASRGFGLFCWVLLTCAAQADDQLVIRAGHLLAVPGQEPASRQTILIQDGRFAQIFDGLQDASSFGEDVAFLDLSEHYVLPGLMDMHVHLLGQVGPRSRTDELFVTTSMKALRGAHYARLTLEAGFTSVRDLGGDSEAIFALRDAVEQGLVPGPRIFAAGNALAATGGHGDVDGYKAELLKLWTPETICDGPHDCRRATRHAVKMGADWIKVTATGGVTSDTATGLGQQMTDDELSEIVRTAHALGVKVAAHAHGTKGIEAALRAGVNSIDHGTFSQSETMKLFQATGAYFVPTLSPGVKIPPTMEGNPFFTDAIKRKAAGAAAAARNSFVNAYRSGVKIALGTDSGVTPHGENADEFVMMVEAGMTPMDAIRSATLVSAELLGVGDKLGTIEVGKEADLIATPDNPLEDITALKNVTTVVKAGRIILHQERGDSPFP